MGGTNRLKDIVPSANGKHERCPPDMAPIPNQEPISKVEKYGWVIIDRPGRFRSLHKTELNVDPEYQRTKVSKARVNTIAATWSWVGLSTLSVARRADGSFWVMDGQHRKLAADQRSDITHLPCMVYEAEGQVSEAKGFLTLNVHRGPVRTLDRFNALVMAADPVATAAKQMIEADGYEVATSYDPRAKNKIKCIGTILSCLQTDADACKISWKLAVALCATTGIIQDRLIAGLFAAQTHLAKGSLGSLLDQHNREALLRIGVKNLMLSIQDSVAYNGGGPKAFGEGIIRAMNKGRSSRRLPSLYSDASN